MKRSASTKTIHIIGGTASLVPPYIYTFLYSHINDKNILSSIAQKANIRKQKPSSLCHATIYILSTTFKFCCILKSNPVDDSGSLRRSRSVTIQTCSKLMNRPSGPAGGYKG